MSAWFDDDFLHHLEALTLQVRRAARGPLMAQRLSRRSGLTGSVFADHRPYATTDDYRHIDWNAVARLDALVVKRFEQERDLTVELLVDTSASMGVGTPAKFDVARRVAAALAYIALDELDRVTVTPFAAAADRAMPAVRGKAAILSVIRFLDALAPAGPTDLAAAATAFAAGPRRRGLVIVVSDWFDPAGFRVALDQLRRHADQVEVIQLYAPEEADPPFRGEVELIDVERPGSARVAVGESARRAYRAAFDGYIADLRRYCGGVGIGCAQGSTGTPLKDLILHTLRDGGVLA